MKNFEGVFILKFIRKLQINHTPLGLSAQNVDSLKMQNDGDSTASDGKYNQFPWALTIDS